MARYTREYLEETRRLAMKDFPPLRTVKRVVQSEDTAVKLATYLIHHSQWFEMTPLPDDEWEFKVKEENSGLMTKFFLLL